MSDELKPCSFCGEAELVCYQGNKAIGTPNALYWYKIVCMKCFCQTGERSERLTDVRKLLAEDWNTRPIEDALRARITKLEAWQKEALPQLDSFKLMINEHEFVYPAVKKVITGMLDKLIKQAEENGK